VHSAGGTRFLDEDAVAVEGDVAVAGADDPDHVLATIVVGVGDDGLRLGLLVGDRARVAVMATSEGEPAVERVRDEIALGSLGDAARRPTTADTREPVAGEPDGVGLGRDEIGR
jgi:hypothetical protein